MASKNDGFLKKLLATFKVEADEHLKAMSSGLMELEKIPAGERRTELVEKIFREAHSLKGAARAVNFTEIETVCHSLESVFAALKGDRLAVSAPLSGLLHQVIDALGGLLAADAGASGARRPAMLAESAASATQAATQIAASSQQQMAGMDQVALAMENIKQASVQNVAGTRQAEVAAQSLHELGSGLKQIAAQYTV